MTWLVCLKEITFYFFLLLRDNGAAAGIWPLITLTVNLIVDHTLTGEPEMRPRSQCVVGLNCTKSGVSLSEAAYTLCSRAPQCTHLAQSSKNAFCKDLFLLAESLELSLPISEFQLSSTRFCFRAKLYFHSAAKQKY